MRRPEGNVSAEVAIDILDAAAGEDAGLLERLADLINGVYATAEDGLWSAGVTRTSAADLAGFVAARETATATVDGRLAGTVRVRAITADIGEFGMLAAAPAYRGMGVGRALVAFAERECRDRGLQAMQLELLVPRTWRHPTKVFLDGWYRRMGYRVIRRTSGEDAHPELVALLATPCDFLVYEKPLGDPDARSR